MMFTYFSAVVVLLAVNGAFPTVGARVAISSRNNANLITLDGHPIDIDKAVVIKEDGNIVVLSPIEVEGATIRLNKEDQSMTIDYKGSHLSIMGPKQAKLTNERIEQEIKHNMEKLREELNRAFGGHINF